MRKLLSMAMILVMAMVAPLLVGCGSDSGSNDNFISYPNSQTKEYEKIYFNQKTYLGDVRASDEDFEEPKITKEEESDVWVSGINLKRSVVIGVITGKEYGDGSTYVGYFPLANIISMKENGSITINGQSNSTPKITNFLETISNNWFKTQEGDIKYEVEFTLGGYILDVYINGDPTPIPTDKKAVFNIGVYSAPAQADTSERAVIKPADYIILAGKQMEYVPTANENNCYMYSGTFSTDELSSIIARGYAKLVYPLDDTNSSTYLGKEFFELALNKLATVGTTNTNVKFFLNTGLDALLVGSDFTIDNNKLDGFEGVVSKDGLVDLSLSGDKVVAYIPVELGLFNNFDSWTLTVIDENENKSGELKSPSDFLSVKTDVTNQAEISITEEGKKQLTSGHTYKVSLKSVTVINQAGESITLKGAGSISYMHNVAVWR